MSGHKLRNGGGNHVHGMAQWIGRKIRHHDPMSEIDDFKAMRGPRLRVGILKDDPSSVVYCMADGRRFLIEVSEVEVEEVELALVAVGA